MAKNVEIKAFATDFEQQLELALAIADTEPRQLIQKDTFFNVSEPANLHQGRLKLRETPDSHAQLIYYQRANKAGPRLSDYHITNTEDASALFFTLEQTLGVVGIVEKTRTLLMVGQTRLHFDQVQGLGNFIELEVVLDNDQSVEQGQSTANSLMQQLQIQSEDLIDVAYIDLLLNS